MARCDPRAVLICLVLLVVASSRATSEEAASSRANGREVGEIDLSTSDASEATSGALNGSEDEESELAGEENNQQDKQKAARFSWDHHLDDHSHYAGRSLISTEKIRQNSNESKSEEDEIDAIDVAKSEGANKLVNSDQLDPLETIDYAEKEWQLMFRALDMAHDSMSSSIMHEIGKQTNLFDDIVSRLKPPCRRDIYHIRDSVKKHKLWALRMLDSNGKLPSGITYGRFSSPGDYEECLGVQVDETLYRDVAKDIKEQYKFHGKYCLIDFRLPLPERPHNKLLSIHESVLNFTGTELGKMYPEIIANYSAYASAFYEVGYLHAFCLPSTCDVTDLTKAIGKAIEGTYIIVNNTIDCEERPRDKPEPLRNSQILSLTLMAALFGNAFLASIAYHLLNKDDVGRRKKELTGQLQLGRHKAATMDRKEADDKRQANIWQPLSNLMFRNSFYSDCFSIQKNFERLTKPDPRGLTFVHYTRLVAMALTVITHTGALGTLQAITKPADASNSESIFRDLIPQMLANAFTTIQIFFFMAGFMLVISTYPSIVRDKGHISFLEYVIKRAIRLMPGLAATICLNFLWPLVVDGPMLKYFVRMIVVPCEERWWHTMGFVSNFDHVEKMCLRHSYFSASDYQLHLIAFPLLLLLYKQPTLSLILAALLTLCGFMAQVIMVLTKTLLPFMMVDYIDKEAFFNVIHYIHHPSWNHMSAFFYGFIIGYLVVKQIRINISPKTIKCLWYIMMPAGIISIFAPYFWNHYKRPIHKWQMVLYVIFDRFTLLSTCAWLSYASMVLSRPPAKKQQASEQKPESAAFKGAELSNKTQANIATFEPPLAPVIRINLEGPTKNLTPNRGSLSSLPRQRSSPDLANIQQQQQQQQQTPSQNDQLARSTLEPRRLSKTLSSSNLDTIAETSANQATKTSPEQAASGQTQPSQKRRAPPVSNINTLCLVLSRLTFQLYLFNMVVLWVDVNHSKYYWFFSYYFIIIKAAAVYICSAIMATIFFVVLESPCLTLYIAWVKSRAASRVKRQQAAEKAAQEVWRRESLGGKQMMGTTINKLAVFQTDTLASMGGQPDKPSFSFIDLSSSPVSSPSAAASDKDGIRRRQENDVDQTRM